MNSGAGLYALQQSADCVSPHPQAGTESTYCEGEGAMEYDEFIRANLERKWQQHITMVGKMTEIIREYGLAHAAMANLSSAYWLDGAAYCKAAELDMSMPDLFGEADDAPASRIRELTKAGALIVAEIERLQRLVAKAGAA